MIENRRSKYNELEHLESSRSEQLATRMAASFGNPSQRDIDLTVGACTVGIQLTRAIASLRP